MSNWYIVWLILLPSLAFSQVEFRALPESNTVLEGSYVEVSFQIANGKDSFFEAPKFKGFSQAGGASTSSSVSIINGVTKQSKSYTYTLLANKVGTYQIGSATATINGKEYKTKPFVIEVLKGRKVSDNDKEAFVKIIASDTTAYVGQQIWLQYKLYTRLNVRQFNIFNEPDYDGFYVEGLEQQTRFKKEIVNGVEYFTRDLQKVALFPQQVGSYEIPNTNVSLGISNKNSNSFFSRIDRQMTVFAEGFLITVQDLPPNAPISFSGAVGKYKMNSRINKRRLTTDDAIAFEMIIEGNGDSRMVDAPVWEVPENIEWYEPNTIVEEQIVTKNSFKRNKEVYEYILVAKRPGVYSFTPSFSYFDVDSNAYVTLQNEHARIAVTQGTNASKEVVLTKDTLALAPIMAKTRLRQNTEASFNRGVYLGGLGVTGLLGIGLLLYRRKLESDGYFDEDIQRRKKAKLQIIQDLEAEMASGDYSQNKRYIELLSLSFRKYINQKFGQRKLQLTDQEIVSLLSDEGMPIEIIERTKEFFSSSTMILYAGANADKRDRLKDSWEQIINGIEEEIQKKAP